LSSIENPSLTDQLGFGICTNSLSELLNYFQGKQSLIDQPAQIPLSLEGFCHVCQSRQEFSVLQHDGVVNWRETLRCPQCDLINRWRSSVHVFETLCAPDNHSRIYITEAVTPLYQKVRERYPLTTGSEYAAGKKSGDWIKACGTRVLVQDVTALSFHENEFDALLSFDVLEHVPDYVAATKEFHRVLKPGGWLVLSAPFSFAEATEIRASIREDGSIEHHLPPDYHGDPLSAEGVLCFQSFGMDLLRLMEQTGFTDARVLGFADQKAGYLGQNILFLAKKPE
jgi:SAM-dependent methyltransferase